MACGLLPRPGVKTHTRRNEAFQTGLTPWIRRATSLAVLAWWLGVPHAGAAESAPIGAGPPSRVWHWQLADPTMAAREGALAVAASPDGRAAVGDGSGLRLRDARGVWRRLALSGAVRDLAYAPDGSLWIASDDGLHRLAGDRLETLVPAAGDAARRVLRVAPGARVVAVATEDGIFWSRDGRRFARVEGSFGAFASRAEPEADEDSNTEAFGELEDAFGDDGTPTVAASSARSDGELGIGLALAEPADPAAPSTLWIAAERGLFRARLDTRDGAARVRARSVRAPAELRPAIDVVLAPGGVVALGDGVLLESDADGGRWRVHRPELPPGARPVRLLATPDGLWIASDRGLVEAPRPGASWSRADEPAGTMPIAALASASGRVFAAGARGLLVGEAMPEPSASGAVGEPPSSEAAPPRPVAATCDPPIAAVRRAVLTHLDLRGERTVRMWDGVNKRALLPVVTLDGSYASDRIRNDARDEAFISNGLRVLHDRDRDSRRDRDVSLRLVWDLRDLVYHDEQIDVSTEMRRTIELRDDVLDEVNQLYFDRRRLLVALDPERASSPEAIEDRLRAEELAAGLDAWTGGWFGPRAGTRACPGEPR